METVEKLTARQKRLLVDELRIAWFQLHIELIVCEKYKASVPVTRVLLLLSDIEQILRQILPNFEQVVSVRLDWILDEMCNDRSGLYEESEGA